MWIMLPEGALSVVQSSENDTMMLVRARQSSVLRKVREGCGKNRCSGIINTPDHDYQYRLFVKKDVFAAWLAHRARTVDYTNFKDAAVSSDLHNLYLKVWTIIYRHYEKRRR